MGKKKPDNLKGERPNNSRRASTTKNTHLRLRKRNAQVKNIVLSRKKRPDPQLGTFNARCFLPPPEFGAPS